MEEAGHIFKQVKICLGCMRKVDKNDFTAPQWREGDDARRCNGCVQHEAQRRHVMDIVMTQSDGDVILQHGSLPEDLEGEDMDDLLGRFAEVQVCIKAEADRRGQKEWQLPQPMKNEISRQVRLAREGRTPAPVPLTASQKKRAQKKRAAARKEAALSETAQARAPSGNEKMCSGCLHTVDKNNFSSEQWKVEIDEIRQCKSCADKHREDLHARHPYLKTKEQHGAPSRTPKPKCDMCSEPSKYRCTICQSRNYCKKACQRQDWTGGHKEACKAIQQTCIETAATIVHALRDPSQNIVKRVEKLELLDNPEIFKQAVKKGLFRSIITFLDEDAMKCSSNFHGNKSRSLALRPTLF
jgi:hypothetical protein